jgi:hypothetical protein
MLTTPFRCPALLYCPDVLPLRRQYLRELRDYQQTIKLFDESAEEIVRDALRKQVGGGLWSCVLWGGKR